MVHMHFICTIKFWLQDKTSHTIESYRFAIKDIVETKGIIVETNNPQSKTLSASQYPKKYKC